MDSKNQEAMYCEADGEYRVYCKICDKLCIKRYYKNHLKSSRHTKNNRKKEKTKSIRLNKMNPNHIYILQMVVLLLSFSSDTNDNK